MKFTRSPLLPEEGRRLLGLVSDKNVLIRIHKEIFCVRFIKRKEINTFAFSRPFKENRHMPCDKKPYVI